MQGLKIVGLCVAGAVIYGITHDLVTANLCVEYFSVFHPPVFATESPWLLALGWGVIATWWMGLFLGVLIASSAQVGRLPKIDWRDLVKPLAVMLACSYALAMAAGAVGHGYADLPKWVVTMAPDLADLAPAKRPWFMFDLFAHNTSYFVSALAALVICVWVIGRRMRLMHAATQIQVLRP